jgi:hypothetical protein
MTAHFTRLRLFGSGLRRGDFRFPDDNEKEHNAQ